MISSDQNEFQEIRENVKAEINELRIGDRKGFRATLVEHERGEHIEADINEALDLCDAYVLLIGNHYSETTEEEFTKILPKGASLMVYRFNTRQYVSATEKENQTKFMRRIMDRGIRIRAYDSPYTRETRLIEAITSDLGILVEQSTHDITKIRKIAKH
ncbi:MAG: DUF4062 domain-containing protein [Nitrososphaerales archaeon]|jgi:hypothetical protein